MNTYTDRLKRTAVAAILLLFGAAGCADLDISNPNDPSREQALTTAGDVEALIVGSLNTWYTGTHHWTNTIWVTNVAFQGISTAANEGNIPMSEIPRVPINNDPAWRDYEPVVNRTWERSYRALAAVADGLRTLEANPDVVATLEAEEEGSVERLRAFGKAVQGIGYATLAIYYDQAFVVDEMSDPNVVPELQPYTEVMAAADGYFDEAIDLATGADWTLPTSWMSASVPAATLVEILHSYRALFTAALPRWSDEAVDWASVMADLDMGLTETFEIEATYSTWINYAYYIAHAVGWTAETYFLTGMADTSGAYQRWIDQPISNRKPWFGQSQGDDPFLIITPDQRFPQGATFAEQRANPGTQFTIPEDDAPPAFYTYTDHFKNPSRGQWRWSYYYAYDGAPYAVYFSDQTLPLIEIEDLNLLRAEALLAMGDEDGAAALINLTRTAAGLSTIDPAAADDGNTSCVPRLPDGSCGDIMEMLKWERRMELKGEGLFSVSGFWDNRRWGDMYYGTPLQWPVPAGELIQLGESVYTFGGAGESPPSASSGSSYAWPDEGP